MKTNNLPSLLLAKMATRIIQMRIACGMSQSDLAHAAEIPEDLLRSYERGDQRPLPLHMFKLCDALAAELRDFFPTLDSHIPPTLPVHQSLFRAS